MRVQSFRRFGKRNCPLDGGGIPREFDSAVCIPSQHALDYRLRAGNVRGIYDVLEETDVKNKNILLVDDIKTSGATLGECALMLKLYGANSVKAVCAALRKG